MIPSKIAEHGLIGNCRTAALVSQRGEVTWACFPHFDSPSWFSSILDEKTGGHFSITPVGDYSSTQSYLPDTNVLATTFVQGPAVARTLDLFSVTTEADKKSRFWPDHEMLRIVEAQKGTLRFRVCFSPKPAFGKIQFQLVRRGHLGIACRTRNQLLLFRSDLPQETFAIHDDGRVEREFIVNAGERIAFSVLFSDCAPEVIPPMGEATYERVDRTIAYWRNWIGICRYSGAHSGQLRRSMLALKLMTFAPSGAVIAAPTTSLPEWIGGVRNYDYRYCWLRDASFTVRAFLDLGFHAEAEAYVNWMLDTCGGPSPRIQVVYSIYGESRIKERLLKNLTGYRDSKPIRIGNAAHSQLQLDVYGEILDSVYHLSRVSNGFDRETSRFLIGMGREICDLWTQPDEGIWEVRSGRAHHTHSKVMLWVALDRLIRLCEDFRWKAPVERFGAVANQIRDSVETYGYNPELGAYVSVYGERHLDASLLALPLFGYCSPSCERMRGTVRAIRNQLTRGPYVYRYRTRDDGFPGEEGAFGVCTFWLIDNLTRSGDVTEARQLLERFLAKGNSLGLWPEEFDPADGEFLGNYPQAFTHVGLIHSIMELDAA